MTTAPVSFWLRLGRVIVIVYIVVILGASIIGAVLFPAYAAQHAAEFTINPHWTYAQVQEGLAQLNWPATVPAYIDLAEAVLTLAIFGGLALLLLWRRPASWFILYLAFTFANSGSGLAQLLLKPLFATLPALQSYSNFMAATWWQFFFLLFYLFPDGRPVPAWTRWLVRAWLMLIILYPFFTDWMDNSPALQIFLSVVVFGVIGSQIYRFFRRSGPLQRQQTKWIVAVLILFMVEAFSTASWSSGAPAGPDLRGDLILALLKPCLDILLFSMVPLAIFMAVIRYRLWDIDLIIRRTLVYGLLTFFLGLVYFGLVTLLQALFVGLSQQQSPLTVVLSTLSIAALFTPLRRRIQSVIDRRFFRSRYDAERILVEFSASLQNEVNVDALKGQLLNTVSETIQPESVGLWIRTGIPPYAVKGEGKYE